MKNLSKAGLLVAGAALVAGVLPLVGTASAAGALTNPSMSVSPVDPSPRKAAVTWGGSAPGPINGWKVVAEPGGRTYDEPNIPLKSHVFDNLTSNKTYTFTLQAYVDADNDPNTPDEAYSGGSFTFDGYTLGAQIGRQRIVSGGATTLSGALKGGPAKSAQPGKTVEIQAKLKGAANFRTVAKVTTGKGGAWSQRLKPRYITKYRAIFTGAGMGSWTEEYQVTVSPRLSIAFSRNPVSLGSKVRIGGRVTNGNVKKLAGQRVSLQRLEGRRWIILRDGKISARGTFATRFQPGNGKDYKYRWITGGGALYGDGVSPAKRLVVN